MNNEIIVIAELSDNRLLPVTYEDEIGGSVPAVVRERKADYGAVPKRRRQR